MTVPVIASEGIMARIPIDWDDPLAVGCQTNQVGSVKWCHDCKVGTCEAACWVCGGPLQHDRPGGFPLPEPTRATSWHGDAPPAIGI